MARHSLSVPAPTPQQKFHRSRPVTASGLAASIALLAGTWAANAQQPAPLNAPERGILLQQLFRTPPDALASKRIAAFATPGSVPIEPRKSIFITDEATMKELTFAAVMDQLANQGGDSSQNKLSVFQQWWDTVAKSPGTRIGPHCDDKAILDQKFPYDCPRPEETEANSNPFDDPASERGYSAIAYSNRLDLANPANPNDCGEARVVFARNSGKTTGTNRNLIIFEARLANPQPAAGLKGCQVIQQFWLDLSLPMTAEDRGTKLRDFYLKGLPGKNVDPVISVGNFLAGKGQIRTNQFMHQGPATGFVWTLREFQIHQLRPGIRFMPVTVKTNPDPSLFSGVGLADLQAKLAGRIADNMTDLRGGPTIADEKSPAFALNLAPPADDRFNSFESNESVEDKGSVAAAFRKNPNGIIGTYLTAKLKELGSATSLSVEHIINRIEVQTCAGCHQWSNANKDFGGGTKPFAPSLGFTHASEQLEDSPEGGKRFKISETLKSEAFIPGRCNLVAEFMGVSNAMCTKVD